eukprot:341941-Rhodomonas_salina.4
MSCLAIREPLSDDTDGLCLSDDTDGLWGDGSLHARWSRASINTDSNTSGKLANVITLFDLSKSNAILSTLRKQMPFCHHPLESGNQTLHQVLRT